MAYPMYSRVALTRDVSKHHLRCGDIATIVETHPGGQEQETGYSLEVFNAVGETIAVITVPESEIEPLAPNEVLHVRRLDQIQV